MSIGIVLFGCALVFSLIAFAKGGPKSILAAIAKSGFTAAFSLIFVSEIGDKVPNLTYDYLHYLCSSTLDTFFSICRLCTSFSSSFNNSICWPP